MSTAAKEIQNTMTEQMSAAEKERADAIMHGWFAFNDNAKAIEDKFSANLEEVGKEVGELICKKLGIENNPVEDRSLELGRLMSDIFRTYQMRLPYTHQLNDALIKEHLKTFSYALKNNILPDLIQHDLDSMYEILSERVYWVEQTGDISLALDAVTTPTCFRSLTIGEGFEWHGNTKVSWISPYKRVLEKGWKRNIWLDVTEEKIHSLWTKPRFLGYAQHLQCNFDISDWDEETRMITIEVSPL
ncbi:MAG: hypothetical protein VYA80_02105 [Pseudomonadota bacterium]|nr:hypothetical protein [Pseudomonadota bacterium]